jgi:hypothetical protein
LEHVPNYDQYLNPDATVIYPHRGKMLLLAIAAIAAVALSFWVWKTEEDIEYHVAGIVGVVFFGGGLIYFLMRLARPRPSLVLTELGMVDNASALGGGFIRWDEIDNVSITPFRNQQFLAIHLNDPTEFLGRQPFIKASIMRMNQGLVGTPICIPRSALPMTLEDVIDKIRQKCPGILVE